MTAQNKSRQPVRATASFVSGEDSTRTTDQISGDSEVSAESAAESGAIDPALQLVIDSWPALPDAIRAKILAMMG
jgi:hypothetical protein